MNIDKIAALFSNTFVAHTVCICINKKSRLVLEANNVGIGDENRI